MINLVKINLPELIIDEIKSYSKTDLIIISHTLNHWQFPDLILKFKPEWWDDKAEGYIEMRRKYRLISPIRKFIDTKTTKREQLYYHNVVYRKAMTKTEFNEWFNNWKCKL